MTLTPRVPYVLGCCPATGKGATSLWNTSHYGLPLQPRSLLDVLI